MTKKISFIHAADLHLDSPFSGLSNTPDLIFNEIRNSTFQALERLVNTAIQKNVDFVLITGDLFDNEKQSLKAQIRLRRAFEELQRYHINVYLSYGNHDYINGNIHPVTYPDNVFVFPNENVSHFTFEKNYEPFANIYGFSYENRSVIEKKVNEYEVQNNGATFHIGMLHGSISNNTDHDVYSPFQLTDLSEKDFNYWALGHIHKRDVLKENPPIVYSGNTQGRSRKETGEKGCYYVELVEGGASLTFIPLQSIIFTNLNLDISQCNEVHQVETELQAELDKLTHSSHVLINLTITGDHSELKNWERKKLLEDIVDLVNETNMNKPIWRFIFRLNVKNHSSLTNEDFYKSEHFIGELVRQFEKQEIQSFVEELFHHKQARKFVKPLTDEEEHGIKREAKEMLLQGLLKE